MKGNKALKRALETKDAVRIGTNLPLIMDETVLITPVLAQEMLGHNKKNRPVNWRRVEEYSKIMLEGKWELHSQGIILDENGNILTGQNRLWGVVYSDTNQYFRISKGNKSSVAHLLDRGKPQTSRDLASRETQKKHSPYEAMIARSILVLRGNLKPSLDEIGKVIVNNSEKAEKILKETSGMKKTKAVLMILGAACEYANGHSIKLDKLSSELEDGLKPATADKCWGKGTAFSMAMEYAKKLIIDRT